MPRILIIEDDPAIMKGLVESLEQEHYEVEQAGDGKQGLELALVQGYDIIILDLILPIVNGEDICRAIRAAKNDTPILVLSSKTREMEKVLEFLKTESGKSFEPKLVDIFLKNLDEIIKIKHIYNK